MTGSNKGSATGHKLLDTDQQFTLGYTLRKEIAREDNQLVFYKVEEAVRGTTYAPLIKPFQRRRQGREAFIVSNERTKAKWLDLGASD